MALKIKLHGDKGLLWGRNNEQRHIEELKKGNIQAKMKPEDNLDQLKVCWQFQYGWKSSGL